ncbi:hypothetical protein [Plebeiibacterium sediminum]|uniref:Uncharacterized protein n=1 Tax=Plebeiibacterium sediminum TaxID=2992112 RepID=A0AAE3SGU7_9BACT|nr:hypothetical protein [Plebeiobacterium sediminum]MCW3787668.1 hypothetical protein [Plebeiobacterium sediminum]
MIYIKKSILLKEMLLNKKNITLGKRIILVFIVTFLHCTIASSKVYQWSVEVDGLISSETNDHPTAFLWIPENCSCVKAVMFGQHNLSEEDLFDRDAFRKGLSDLNIAIVWVSPAFDMTFDFNNGSGKIVENIMNDLAEVSGYGELAYAPIIPIGHSACASFPWNFAAWNPQRTLAVISLHGDAPLTNLTGNGRPHPKWDRRNIDGIPGLMIEGEYEWMEERVQPALDFKARYPNSTISFLCDAGHGHFDVSDVLVDYLLLFIQKAVQYRIPERYLYVNRLDLISINPQDGWLKERWKKGVHPKSKAASYDNYKGDKANAFWYFDKEMAMATEVYYARERGKKDRYIGLKQKGNLINYNEKSHSRMNGYFNPENDGLTFYINAVVTDSLRQTELENTSQEKPLISKTCGSVQQINDTTFTVRFFRMGMNNQKRTGDIWLLAKMEGNNEYKSSIQQFYLKIPLKNSEGDDQTIVFSDIRDQNVNNKRVNLNAKATSGLPVYYYIKEGPAIIEGDDIVFTSIPPKAKFPVKVTVVAWQYGRNTEPKVKTANFEERTFYLTRD